MLLSLTATSFHAAWSSSSLETIWPARATNKQRISNCRSEIATGSPEALRRRRAGSSSKDSKTKLGPVGTGELYSRAVPRDILDFLARIVVTPTDAGHC